MGYRFGPLRQGGRLLLQCWAPGAEQVTALIDPGTAGERRLAMTAEPDGFFHIALEAHPGCRYLFSRDGGPALPDPASRCQPQGVHAPSLVIDLDYPWRDASWRGLAPEELCIYELHLGTFSEEGSYAGAEAHLDELAALGVTALELLPLAAFPGQRGWGYDGTFHFAPFAGYGEPRQLQHLIDACHARGLAVILDVVTNHFGPEGNAMWGLAPDFFRPQRPTAWSSGINWDADPVLTYFEEMAAFWTRTYHLDGLRFDAFHAVPREARGVHLQRMLAAIERELAPGRHFTALLESVDNQSSLLSWPDPRLHVTQLNFDYQRACHSLLTGERHGEYQDYQPPEADLQRCLADGFSFLGRFSAHHRRVRGEAVPPASWNAVVNYLQNHDTVGNRYLGQRLDRLASPQAIRAATALLLLHPGIPFLFMGQEWGASTPFFFFTDLPDHLLASVKAGRRAGFRELDPEQCQERAPDCDEELALRRSRLDRSEQARSPHRELQAMVRDLLQLRRALLPGLSRRRVDTQVLAEGRLFLIKLPAEAAGQAGYLIAANLQDRAAALPGLPPAQLLFSSSPVAGGRLPPFCTALYRAGG